MKNKVKTGQQGVGFKNVFRMTEVSMLILIAVIFIIASIGTQNFFSAYNLTNIVRQCAIIGVIAIAETFIIITGGIDISVGSITGMSTLLVAMGQAKWGFSIPVSILVAIVVATVCGLINAVIIYEFNVPPFIATMGTQTVLRGLIKVICNGGTVSGINFDFSNFANVSLFGVLPYLALIWITIGVIAFLILRYSVFGRNIFVLGSGHEVAKLCGISLRKIHYQVYSLTGLLCGIAGVMLCARINSSVPGAGQGYEMNAIAATVLGGASLAGGKGSVLGTALGTLLIIIIDNAGIQFGIHTFIMEMVTGALIIIAVVLDQLKNRGTR